MFMLPRACLFLKTSLVSVLLALGEHKPSHQPTRKILCPKYSRFKGSPYQEGEDCRTA